MAERDDLEAARIVLQRLASRQKDSATDTLLFGKLCQELSPRRLLLLLTIVLLILGMPFLVSSGALLPRSRRRTARASPQRRGRHRRRRRGAAGAGGGEARSPHISPYLPPISLQAQAEAIGITALHAPSYSTHAQRSALRRVLVRLRLDLCCSSQVRHSQATVRRQPCAGAGTALRCVRVADGAHHCHCDSHRLAFTNVVVKW